jgi:hypothetical protein
MLIENCKLKIVNFCRRQGGFAIFPLVILVTALAGTLLGTIAVSRQTRTESKAAGVGKYAPVDMNFSLNGNTLTARGKVCRKKNRTAGNEDIVLWAKAATSNINGSSWQRIADYTDYSGNTNGASQNYASCSPIASANFTVTDDFLTSGCADGSLNWRITIEGARDSEGNMEVVLPESQCSSPTQPPSPGGNITKCEITYLDKRHNVGGTPITEAEVGENIWIKTEGTADTDAITGYTLRASGFDIVPNPRNVNFPAKNSFGPNSWGPSAYDSPGAKSATLQIRYLDANGATQTYPCSASITITASSQPTTPPGQCPSEPVATPSEFSDCSPAKTSPSITVSIPNANSWFTNPQIDYQLSGGSSNPTVYRLLVFAQEGSARKIWKGWEENDMIQTSNTQGTISLDKSKVNIQDVTEVWVLVRSIYRNSAGGDCFCRSNPYGESSHLTRDAGDLPTPTQPPAGSCTLSIPAGDDFKADPAETSQESCPATGGTRGKYGFNRATQDWNRNAGDNTVYEYKIYAEKTNGEPIENYDLLGTVSFNSRGDRDQFIKYTDLTSSLCNENFKYFVTVQKKCSANSTSNIIQSNITNAWIGCCGGGAGQNDPANYCENTLGGECGVTANPSSPGNCPSGTTIADDSNLWNNHFCKVEGDYDYGACCIPSGGSGGAPAPSAEPSVSPGTGFICPLNQVCSTISDCPAANQHRRRCSGDSWSVCCDSSAVSPPPAAGTISLGANSTCDGTNGFVNLRWSSTNNDTSFEILKDNNRLMTVPRGTRCTRSGNGYNCRMRLGETENENHTWQIRGVDTNISSNDVSLKTKLCIVDSGECQARGFVCKSDQTCPADKRVGRCSNNLTLSYCCNTAADTTLSAPRLLSPENGAQLTFDPSINPQAELTFDWDNVDGAEEYLVSYRSHCRLSGVASWEYRTTDSRLLYNPSNCDRLFWPKTIGWDVKAVRTSGSNDFGPTSQHWEFTVRPQSGTEEQALPGGESTVSSPQDRTDVDGDGRVLARDYDAIVRDYGATCEKNKGKLKDTDVNFDCRVNGVDLSLVITQIGQAAAAAETKTGVKLLPTAPAAAKKEQ